MHFVTLKQLYVRETGATGTGSLSAGLTCSPGGSVGKGSPAVQETPVPSLGQEDLLKKGQLYTPVFLGFPGGSAGEESACNMGGLGLIPTLGRFPWRREGYPFQCSGLENSMGYTGHGVAKSRT